MNTKKYLVSAVSLAVVANAALAGLTFAETGSTTVVDGDTVLTLTSGASGSTFSGSTLSFGTGTGVCTGAVTTSSSNVEVCAILEYDVEDLNSANENHDIDADWANASSAGNFLGGTTAFTTSFTDGTAGMESLNSTAPVIVPPASNTAITANGGGGTESAVSRGGYADGVPAEILDIDDGTGGAGDLFTYTATDVVEFEFEIEKYAPADTYTATLTLTLTDS